jgi:hypothetical protein
LVCWLCARWAASRTGKWSLHVRGSSVDYPSLCLPTIWLFFLTASVPWRKRCWSACWNHQGKLLSLSQLNSCISLLYLQFNPIISQVLGTPTREEIKCMNPNYTEFKFPQIKAHPWHKVGILYWILCPLFLSLTSTRGIRYQNRAEDVPADFMVKLIPEHARKQCAFVGWWSLDKRMTARWLAEDQVNVC